MLAGLLSKTTRPREKSGFRKSRTSDIQSHFDLHSTLAEFARSLGGRLNGVHQDAAQAALFEALQTGTVAYYTTPLIALTEQKFHEMQAAAERWGTTC